MVRKTHFTSLLATGAVIIAMTTPAHAGKRDRAQEAIAAAEAKIHTAETLGAGVEVPAATASARAALATAREDLASGRKSASIEGAIQASAFADTAIGELQRRKNEDLATARASERASAAAAQDQVESARLQADAAQQQAATAQQQAAEANLRASAAEQSAASSAADAAAARNAAAAQPTQVETTVTTQQRGAATHRTTKTKVTKRPASTAPAPAAPQVTTTTRVTQP